MEGVHLALEAVHVLLLLAPAFLGRDLEIIELGKLLCLKTQCLSAIINVVCHNCNHVNPSMLRPLTTTDLVLDFPPDFLERFFLLLGERQPLGHGVAFAEQGPLFLVG